MRYMASVEFMIEAESEKEVEQIIKSEVITPNFEGQYDARFIGWANIAIHPMDADVVNVR